MASVISKTIEILNLLKSKHPYGFERLLYDVVKPVGGTFGNVVYEMKVEKEHCNGHGGLHGAFSSLLVDFLSSISLVTADNPPGVSVDLHTRYLRSAKAGDTLLIETHTQKRGRYLAYSIVDIKCKDTGELLVQGTHTKFLTSENLFVENSKI